MGEPAKGATKLRLILGWGSLILAVGLSTHYYLWKRLVQDPGWPDSWTSWATAAIVCLGLAFPVTYPVTLRFGPVFPRFVVLGTYAWLGCAYYILFSFLAIDAVRGVAGALGSPGTGDGRTRFALAVCIGLAVAATAFRQARRGPVLERVVVRLAELPEGLRGLCIAQISDVHIGSLPPSGYLRGIVDQVRAARPDLVVLTGDLIEERVSHFGAELAPLADLEASLGVFFVTGNHDYYAGISDVVSELGRLGVKVLRNERVRLTRSGSPLDLAGVDDPTGAAFPDHGPRYEEALAGRDTGVPVIVLAHDPRSIEETSRYGIDLQMSGHTHGGQIWPGRYLVRLITPYLEGLYHLENGAQIYVTRGAGNLGLPMRLWRRAAITLIELQPST